MLAVAASIFFFFFNDTATTEIYTLSLHDALPILVCTSLLSTSLIATWSAIVTVIGAGVPVLPSVTAAGSVTVIRSEEHTSVLQSRQDLVCRLLLDEELKVNLASTVSPPDR